MATVEADGFCNIHNNYYYYYFTVSCFVKSLLDKADANHKMNENIRTALPHDSQALLSLSTAERRD